MAQISPDIKNSIERFYLALKQYKHITSFYLFGSYAKGTANEMSDIDIAVVSDDFIKDRVDAQIELLQLAALIDDRLEPRAYKSEDFNFNNPIAYEILKHGVKLH